MSRAKQIIEKLQALKESPQRLYTKDEIESLNLSELDKQLKRTIDPNVFVKHKHKLDKVLMYFNKHFEFRQAFTIDHLMTGSVYKVDKSFLKRLENNVHYFIGDNGNTEVNLYAHVETMDMYIGTKRYKGCGKCLIWKNSLTSPKSMTDFVFNYILPDYQILISDYLYTSLGEKSLDRLIQSAFNRNLKVGVCKGFDNYQDFISYLDTYQDYIKSKKTYFGDGLDKQIYRYFIMK